MMATFADFVPLTASQARELQARLDRYITWVRERFGNGWACYDPDDVPENCRLTNEERSKLEIHDWVNDPPRRYFAYVFHPDDLKKRYIGTWTGDKLARISILGGRVRDNFGGCRRYISAYGTNGVRYWGWYYESAGDYCRLTAFKGQKTDGKE